MRRSSEGVAARAALLGCLIAGLTGCTENRRLAAELREQLLRNEQLRAEIKPLAEESDDLVKQIGEATTLVQKQSASTKQGPDGGRPDLAQLEFNLSREKAELGAIKSELAGYRQRFAKD